MKNANDQNFFIFVGALTKGYTEYKVAIYAKIPNNLIWSKYQRYMLSLIFCLKISSN